MNSLVVVVVLVSVAALSRGFPEPGGQWGGAQGGGFGSRGGVGAQPYGAATWAAGGRGGRNGFGPQGGSFGAHGGGYSPQGGNFGHGGGSGPQNGGGFGHGGGFGPQNGGRWAQGGQGQSSYASAARGFDHGQRRGASLPYGAGTFADRGQLTQGGRGGW